MAIVISLKGDHQGSIVLTHNSVFYSRTKNIDIYHHYLRDELGVKRIKLSYVSIEKMIADDLIKSLTYGKFYSFIEEMRMTQEDHFSFATNRKL